ncbi:mucin-7-like [Bolinopsis microptera]|uniref:mucin-7-like n=1 Tax=Bolinopsis microptera TaxID=2820187 RepID=UPI00307A220F
MKQRYYPQWDSQFYDSVFANPAPDPLKNLKEVSNTTSTVLGSSAILSIKSLKASCSAIVKLSQEGSTYYSSIRDTSSASGSYQYQPPVLTSDAKVSGWFADHVGATSQSAPETTSTPPPPNSFTPHQTSTTIPDEHTRPPRTSSTVPDPQIPSSPGGSGVRGSNIASSSSRGKQPMTRPPRPPSMPVPPEASAIPPQSLQIQNEPRSSKSAISGSKETVTTPRRPHNTPITPHSRAARNRALLTDQDKDIIKGLKEHGVPLNQTKIFIKNVPTTPTTREDVNTLLLKHVEQVHELEHVEEMIIAITDTKGSKEFRDQLDGTVLGGSTAPLVIVLID